MTPRGGTMPAHEGIYPSARRDHHSGDFAAARGSWRGRSLRYSGLAEGGQVGHHTGRPERGAEGRQVVREE